MYSVSAILLLNKSNGKPKKNGYSGKDDCEYNRCRIAISGMDKINTENGAINDYNADYIKKDLSQYRFQLHKFLLSIMNSYFKHDG